MRDIGVCEFTILMPCLNEAASLKFCITEAKGYIERYHLDAEILNADNGSTDGSVQIAKKEGVRVTTIEKRGYGAALIGGIRAARGRYIIMIDADGSYDFNDINQVLSLLKKDVEKGAMRISHVLGVRALSAFAGWRFQARNIRDFHCGLRAFDRKKALELNLQCPGMEFATEMIARFAMSGEKIAEVPVSLRKDKREGKSHLRTIRDGMRHLYFILYKKARG